MRYRPKAAATLAIARCDPAIASACSARNPPQPRASRNRGHHHGERRPLIISLASPAGAYASTTAPAAERAVPSPARVTKPLVTHSNPDT
jgi:hypothetical protein